MLTLVNSFKSNSDTVEWILACCCLIFSLLFSGITLNIFLFFAGILSIHKIAWRWKPYTICSIITRGLLFLGILNTTFVTSDLTLCFGLTCTSFAFLSFINT